MWSQIVLVSVFLWGFGSSNSVDDCPDNLPRNKYLQVFENKCYYFYVYLKREFDDAQAYCRRSGGNLASVKSSRVNAFLWLKLKYTYHVNEDVWIGLSDRDDEGVYLWRDGSRMTYRNFKSGTGPDTPVLDITDRYQDCVVIDHDANGKWKDIKCKGIFNEDDEHFVCEYPRKPPTTTARATTTAMPHTSQETSAQTLSPEKTTGRDRGFSTAATTVTKDDVTTQEVTPSDATTQEATPSDATTQEATPSDATTQKATPSDETTQEATPSDAPTQEATPSDATTQEATPSDETTQEATPSDATTQEATPSDATTQEATPSRTTPNAARNKKTSPVSTTCQTLVCDLDCGMLGFRSDPVSGCTLCECGEE